MRIVLDAVFQDSCWNHLKKGKVPAYKQLSEAQLVQAIAIAQSLLDEPNDHIQRLNSQSKAWRENARALL